MTITVEASYADGKIILPQPLPVPDDTLVRVTIESGDVEREAWLNHSKEFLLKTWNSPGDDVFNELLSR